jgi:uncharacterized circularly permuted ATP-grasp superfamily protein/uncharacterized alpha-E superfamily protein
VNALPAPPDVDATIDALGVAALIARRDEADRLVADEGVLGERGKRFRVDPLPVVLDAPGWARLEAGVRQRAQLLDALLADLQGPRALLRRGVVPVEVVCAHPGFLRTALDLPTPGGHALVLSAVDLAPQPDGDWLVLADRTQAPLGAGYAMQTRRIVSRVMPGLYRSTPLRRLRTFFHVLREALQQAAPPTAEDPRVVLLADPDRGFDQAFLATLLGCPQVSGEDLVVTEGRVWLRTLGRLDAVDVVLRRLAADQVDPLDLSPTAQDGVAGLLEVARRGGVSIVNPVTAAVLENPGLTPYLPAVCRALLDEDLLLRSPSGFWCGDPDQRAQVFARLDELTVSPLAGGPVIEGGLRSRADREQLVARIETEPYLWCASERPGSSTVPVVGDIGIEQRHLTVRAFTVAGGGGLEVLSGGLARATVSPGLRDLDGAVTKDVWVMAHEAVPGAVELVPPPARRGDEAAGLSPRIAENLFWLSRYAERAEGLVRLLRVADDLSEDWRARPDTPGAAALDLVLEALATMTGTATTTLSDATSRSDSGGLAQLVVGRRDGTVAHAVGRAVTAAQAVREQLSIDTWMVLGSLERALADLAAVAGEGAPRRLTVPALQPTLARLLEGLLALSGLAAESMIRDTGWYLLDAGRRIERAQQMVTLLCHTVVPEVCAEAQAVVLEAVLVAGESVITHRRRYRGRAGVDTVVDLLVLDHANPRSVAAQLDRLVDDLRHLPSGTAAAGRLNQITTRLADVDGDDVGGLLDRLEDDLADLSRSVIDEHFAPPIPARAVAATPWWQR